MKKLLGVGGIAALLGLALSPYNPLLLVDSAARLPILFLALVCAGLCLLAFRQQAQIQALTNRNKELEDKSESCRQELLNAREDMRIWQKTLASEHLMTRGGGITPRGDVVKFDAESTEERDRKRITRSLSRDKIAAALSSLEEED